MQHSRNSTKGADSTFKCFQPFLTCQINLNTSRVLFFWVVYIQKILLPIIVLIVVVVAVAAIIFTNYGPDGQAIGGLGKTGANDFGKNTGLPPSKPKLPCSYIGLEVCGNSIDEDCDGTAKKCACNDGIDNDGDTKIDYNYTDWNGSNPNKSDPGCTSYTDDSELGTIQCDNGLDDDSDTKIDYPNDPSCTSPSDNTELGTTQCDNNIDDDNDLKIDYPNDTDCYNINDNSEKNPCSETDGGFNLFQKGTCTDAGNCKSGCTDECTIYGNVRERDCDLYGNACGDSAGASCPSGYTCIDGACK